MSNPSSLKPFQSGPDPRRNTKGRPKGSSNMKKLLMKELQKELGIIDGKKIKGDELLVRRLVDIALNDPKVERKMWAMKFIWEKIDGKERAQTSTSQYKEWQLDEDRKDELMKLIGLKKETDK